MSEVGRWYPQMPPRFEGETLGAYTDRLTGADGTERRPYDHRRFRQCSIGYHEECSDREHSGRCECPCHVELCHAGSLMATWNALFPPGTRVAFPAGVDEPETVTTSAASVSTGPGGRDGFPVVSLEGFANPVKLSWLLPLEGEA